MVFFYFILFWFRLYFFLYYYQFTLYLFYLLSFCYDFSCFVPNYKTLLVVLNHLEIDRIDSFFLSSEYIDFTLILSTVFLNKVSLFFSNTLLWYLLIYGFVTYWIYFTHLRTFWVTLFWLSTSLSLILSGNWSPL